MYVERMNKILLYERDKIEQLGNLLVFESRKTRQIFRKLVQKLGTFTCSVINTKYTVEKCFGREYIFLRFFHFY